MKKFCCFSLSIVIMCFSAFMCRTSVYAENDGIFTYRTEGEYAVISGIDRSVGGEITLPSTLGGLTVSGIDDWAFSNNSLINLVTIPNTVLKIGDGAFAGCINLIGVVMPDSVTYIGWDAFWNCTKLKNVTIPDGVKSVGGFAFSGCSSLETVKLGGNVSSIGSFAFENCTSLKTVYFSESLERLGNSAFYGCESLSDIYYPLDKNSRAKITVSADNRLSKFVWHYENSPGGHLPGDINDDGTVNNIDLITLFQEFSGWEVKANKDSLDTNGDGKENNQDLICLFQFLSGWEIEVF